MIINQKGFLQSHSNPHKVGHYLVYAKGFYFFSKHPSGSRSISKFLLELDAGKDIREISSLLKGQYFLCVLNEVTRHIYCFTDESGSYNAFYSEDFVSDSFLELSKHLNLGVKDLNPSAVAEFIHWGNLHHDRTFFEKIKKIKGDQIITFDSSGTMQLFSKLNCSIDSPSRIVSFPAYMESVSNAIRDEKIVVDITGGIDSRLLVSALNYYNVDFDLAVSGTENTKDVLIAKVVASRLNKKLLINYHHLEKIEQELDEIFYITEGLYTIVNYHRPYQLSKMRKEAGYTLSISGAGGEIYKEFTWLHDFPFYSKQKTNFNRYYHLRFCPISPEHNLLTGVYHDASVQLKEKIISEWSNCFLKPTNSQTYDTIYFNYKWPLYMGCFITNNSKLVSCYAPLIEMDLAKYTYSLPRRDRVLNRFHRKWISFFSPLLSRIPTTEGGMSVSNEASFVIPDTIKYILNRCKRLANKTGQKILGRTLLPHQNPNHIDFVSTLRSLPAFELAVRHLQKEYIINSRVAPTQINDRNVGSILTLSKLLLELK